MSVWRGFLFRFVFMHKLKCGRALRLILHLNSIPPIFFAQAESVNKSLPNSNMQYVCVCAYAPHGTLHS